METTKIPYTFYVESTPNPAALKFVANKQTKINFPFQVIQNHAF